VFSANFVTFNVTSGVEQIRRQELAVPNLTASFPHLERVKEEIIVTNYLNK
jgi:hypothetical protein